MTCEDPLAEWNILETKAATSLILPCNGSKAWADGMVSMRPYVNQKRLLRMSDRLWWSLPRARWQEAFDSHPRIGERKAAAGFEKGLLWSVGEQAGISDEETVRAELKDANRLYEDRFGRIFIICASGKSAAAILESLQARLANDPETELLETAEQQRRITQLRLRKWLGIQNARCEDV